MEQRAHLFGGHARPRVFNLANQRQGWAVRLRLAANADAKRDAAFRREFQRVAQQIQQNLPEFRVVNLRMLRHARIAIIPKTQTFVLRPQPEHFRHVVEQSAQFHCPLAQRHFSGFDFGQIQHLINQVQQMLAALNDDIEAMLFFYRQRAAARHQLRKA